MRLLKAQNTNLRNIYGKGVKYDINDQVIIDSTNTVLVPKGTTAQRPSSPVNGHFRYNTEDDRFEIYEAGAWSGVRGIAPVSVGITQQNLGNGDASSVIFGPLDSNDPEYPSPVSAQSILVFVENVFQISTTNYSMSQNPAASNSGAEINDGSLVPGTEYYIITQGTSDFTTLGAADNNPDTVFTATGIDSGGDGTVRETGYYLQFTSAPDLAKPITVLHNFDK